MRRIVLALAMGAALTATSPTPALSPGACTHVLSDEAQTCMRRLHRGIPRIEYQAVATAGDFFVQVLDDQGVLVWQMRCEPATTAEGSCEVERGTSPWSMWLHGETSQPSPGVLTGGQTTFLPKGGSMWLVSSAGSGAVALHTLDS